MRYFRIDHRKFKGGDIITPDNIFAQRIDPKRAEVEKILLECKPRLLPDRNTILKVFSDFNKALDYWTIVPNSTFYRVSIDETGILFIGDFGLVQRIHETHDPNDRKKQADDYWTGYVSGIGIGPAEIFVTEAVVVGIVSDNEGERKNEWCARHNLDLLPGKRRVVDNT